MSNFQQDLGTRLGGDLEETTYDERALYLCILPHVPLQKS